MVTLSIFVHRFESRLRHPNGFCHSLMLHATVRPLVAQWVVEFQVGRDLAKILRWKMDLTLIGKMKSRAYVVKICSILWNRKVYYINRLFWVVPTRIKSLGKNHLAYHKLSGRLQFCGRLQYDEEWLTFRFVLEKKIYFKLRPKYNTSQKHESTSCFCGALYKALLSARSLCEGDQKLLDERWARAHTKITEHERKKIKNT